MNLLKLFAVHFLSYSTPEKPPERVRITASAGLSKKIKTIFKWILAFFISLYMIGLACQIAWGHDFKYSELFYHSNGTPSIIGTNLDYVYRYGMTLHKFESDGLWHIYFISKDHKVIHLSKFGGKTVKETIQILHKKMKEIDERSKK